jgi:uncharacterized membrane protein
MNESSWNNSSNWYFYESIYYSKNDTRLLVPKKMKWMGWTLNFAHPYAYATFGAIVGVPLATTAGIIYLQTRKRGGL